MQKFWLSRLRSVVRSGMCAQKSRRKMTETVRRPAAMMEYLEHRTLLTGDVTGTVFHDVNANGVDDPEDDGLAGWTVFVDSNGDGTLNSGERSTVTDFRGKYEMLGLPVGVISVREIVQPGYFPTPGFSDQQTVEVRENKETRVKFGNVTAPVTTGQIVGTVFQDDNENGIKEPGEHGLQGWTMFIDTSGDGLLTAGEATAVTDADGDYLFADVPAGPAVVYEIPVAGIRPTVGGIFPLDGASDHRAVTVVAGSSVRANFSNLTPQVGTIRGIVWNDANGDGIRGASESPLVNRPVYIDLNNNGLPDATEPTRLTDSTGAYTFANIHTGTWRVSEVIPAGYVAVEGRPASLLSTVFIGSLNTVDFYNLLPIDGSISGSLWDDADGNGLRSVSEPSLVGWQVFIDLNSNAVLDAAEPQALTGPDGSYQFTGLSHGNKTVREIVPASWLATNPAAGFTTLRLLNGENRTGVNFGNRERVGTIRGNVWNDDDGDRLKGAAESGLTDWTVFLDLNSDGLQDLAEPAVQTDSSGNYTFNRVPVGTYRVTEVLPSAWITSVGKPAAVSTSVVIGGVSTVDYYNLIPVTGSVSGIIFSDVDSNGVMAGTEAGLEGWQVYADLNSSGTPDVGEPTATTDAAGVYTIVGVPYGNNVIREVVQPGAIPTTHPGGVTTLLLLNGENRTGILFGNHEPADFVISGTAFKDANRNGQLDAGEAGLSGITVYLDSNNNGVLDTGEPTAVTSIDRFFTPAVNEAGTYAFTHLPRGTYHVREILTPELDGTPVSSREATVLVPSAAQTAVNFANVYRDNEIHGVIFDDTDADGVRDAHEYARPGVPVYIDLDRDDVLDIDEPHTVSGADGSYVFPGLTPGNYIVREDNSTVGPHTYPGTGGGTLWPGGVSHPSSGNVTPTSITTSLAQGETYTQTVSLTLPGSGSISNMVDVFLLFDDTGSFAGNSPLVRAAFPTIISTLQASLPGIDLGFGVGRFEEYGSFAGEFATGRPFILNQPIVESTRPGFSAAIQAALDRMAPGFGGDGPETDIEALYQLVTGQGFDGNNNGTTTDSGPAGPASTQLTPGASGDVPGFSSFTADPTNNVLAAAGNVGGGGFRPGALPVILTATDIGFAYQPRGETTITGSGGVTLPVSALTQVSRPTTPFGAGAGLQDTVTGLNALGALVIGLGTNADAAVDPRQGLEALAQLTGAVNRSTTSIANGTANPVDPGDPFYFQINTGFGTTVADGVTNAIQNAVTNVAMDITLRASDPRVHIINHTGTLTGIGSGQTATFDVEFIGDGRPSRFDLQFVRQGTEVVLGSIPVVLGTPVPGDGYNYDELEDGEIHHSSHFGNYVANTAPSFTAGGNQTVLLDAGPSTVSGWATGISPGPATESAQTVDFVVTTSNPALFSVQPSIASDGTLTFTPAAGVSGISEVTVLLHDNGGVGISGADTSAPQMFLISVASSNSAPTDLNLSGNVVSENLFSGAVVGSFSTSDPDPGNTFTYALVAGDGSTDNGSFSVGSDGVLRTAAAFDFETKSSYSIRVRTTDQGGLSFDKVFTVGVLNQPEGTAGNDVFVLTYAGTAPSGTVTISVASGGLPAKSLGVFPQSSPLTLYGFAGTDSVRVVTTTGNDVLDVSGTGIQINGATLVLTGTEALTLAGGAGNDTYQFDADTALGLITLDESLGGLDTLDFTPTTSLSVTVNLGLSTSQTINTNLSLIAGSVSTFENAIGGSGNDTITGNAIANQLRGGIGSDSVSGMAGNDVLEGDVGNDTLAGGAGDDTYHFNTDSSLGSDLLTDAVGVETISFEGTTSAVVLNLSLTSAQTVSSGTTLTLASGTTFDNLTGGNGDDTLTGNAGTNILVGSGGNDLLAAAAGNDTYLFDADSSLGSDTLLDAVGTDTLSFVGTTSDVSLNLGNAATQTVNSFLQLTLGSAVTFDNAIGGSGSDLLTGNSGVNSLSGEGGNDTLVGAAGNDTYLYDADAVLGTDTINESGGGIDTISFGLTTTKTVALDLGSVAVQAVNSNLSLQLLSGTAVENVLGGSLSNTLTGNSLANTLTGGAAADVLNGAAGNDILVGGAGNDTLVGGSGNDSYTLDGDLAQGIDTIDESAGGIDTLDFGLTTTRSVTVDLSQSLIQNTFSSVSTTNSLILGSATTLENIIGGALNDHLTGNALSNTLTGNAGGDTISGSDGTDLLIGNAGNDLLNGGAGDDQYQFDADAAGGLGVDSVEDSAGVDTLDFALTTTVGLGITLDLAVTTVQVLNSGLSLTLQPGTEIESVFGTALNDTIRGNSTANILVGNAGDDVLDGREGRDILIGGTGADQLNGGIDDDILIAGRTSYDALPRSLFDLRTEWTSASTILTRMTNLKTAAGVGVTAASLRPKVTVLTDGTPSDILTGGDGEDWLFRALNDVFDASGEFLELL